MSLYKDGSSYVFTHIFLIVQLSLTLFSSSFPSYGFYKTITVFGVDKVYRTRSGGFMAI